MAAHDPTRRRRIRPRREIGGPFYLFMFMFRYPSLMMMMMRRRRRTMMMMSGGSGTRATGLLLLLIIGTKVRRIHSHDTGLLSSRCGCCCCCCRLQQVQANPASAATNAPPPRNPSAKSRRRPRQSKHEIIELIRSRQAMPRRPRDHAQDHY